MGFILKTKKLIYINRAHVTTNLGDNDWYYAKMAVASQSDRENCFSSHLSFWRGKWKMWQYFSLCFLFMQIMMFWNWKKKKSIINCFLWNLTFSIYQMYGSFWKCLSFLFWQALILQWFVPEMLLKSMGPFKTFVQEIFWKHIYRVEEWIPVSYHEQTTPFLLRKYNFISLALNC